MSRVVYANTQATPDQEALRAAHAVRIVTAEEEGTGVDRLPVGVYGFTYSPGLPNAPLFAQRRYRSYEIHKLASGEVFIVGFTTRALACDLSTAQGELSLQVQPEPEREFDTLVTIPYSRIRQHRQYAAPHQHGFMVTVLS
ncbi:MAG: hypothetical protein HY657_07585 [Acidobacteria bacterium]|nr:hypothetical protein [Acidobacteriota bacterium]